MTHKDFSVRDPNQKPRILPLKTALINQGAAPIAANANNSAHSCGRKPTVSASAKRTSPAVAQAAVSFRGFGSITRGHSAQLARSEASLAFPEVILAKLFLMLFRLALD